MTTATIMFILMLIIGYFLTISFMVNKIKMIEEELEMYKQLYHDYERLYYSEYLKGVEYGYNEGIKTEHKR